ncbi:MAG: helix-turn-helix domain-containing protein [bacterium]|nr:helix-turn-helix domain-containing protein [bacterium]
MQTPPKNDTDYLLTPKEVRPILKVSLPTIYNLVERGQLPAVIWESPIRSGKKSQRTIRIKRSDVFKFVEAHYSRGDQ